MYVCLSYIGPRATSRGGGHTPYGRFPKFHRVFLGRDPGTLKSDIVSKKTSTTNLLGFETLKLKIRRLKLWKPTVRPISLLTLPCGAVLARRCYDISASY